MQEQEWDLSAGILIASSRNRTGVKAMTLGTWHSFLSDSIHTESIGYLQDEVLDMAQIMFFPISMIPSREA